MGIDFYVMYGSVPCRAVIMTLRYLEIEVNDVFVDLLNYGHLDPEFVKVNPQHCVPVINDDGFILGESRAIQTYLVNKYRPDSSLYPTDSKKRAAIDRMLYFDTGTLFRSAKDFLLPPLLKTADPDPLKEKEFADALEIFETFLGQTPYAAGDQLSLADFSLFAGLTFVEMAEYDLSAYPKILDWMQKLKRELPFHEEVNDLPLKEFKKFFDARK